MLLVIKIIIVTIIIMIINSFIIVRKENIDLTNNMSKKHVCNLIKRSFMSYKKHLQKSGPIVEFA